MTYVDIHFCSDRYMLISNNKRLVYLSNNGYDIITIFGFDYNNKVSFLCHINNIDQLGCIYYQLHEYNPKIYNKTFNVYILDPCNYNNKLKNKIINNIFLYNKYWNNKIKFELNIKFDIDTRFYLVINTKDQQLLYNNNYKKSDFIDNRYFFNSINCKLLLE